MNREDLLHFDPEPFSNEEIFGDVFPESIVDEVNTLDLLRLHYPQIITQLERILRNDKKTFNLSMNSKPFGEEVEKLIANRKDQEKIANALGIRLGIDKKQILIARAVA